MSEIVEKKLNKNYGAVQKTEVKYNESIEKIETQHEKVMKQLATTLKSETKQYKDLEKEVKAEHKALLKKIKDEYKEATKAVADKVKEANNLYKAEIKAADELNVKTVTKIKGLIEKANNDAVKLNEKVQKQYNKDVEDNDKEQASIQANFEEDTQKENDKFQAKKEKYEEKVQTLNEKRDNKTAKLKETSEKKITKLQEDIRKQREKTDNLHESNLPVYEQKIADLDQQLQEERDEYNEAVAEIKKTLDEKLTRRNKFLEQAENQGDNKAAKIQRKEIKVINQNAERELKTLKQAHDERIKDLNAKKLEINKNNLESIAAIEREFTNFEQDALMQIELNRVTLTDDLETVRLETELKLKDELSKFNQIENAHIIKLGELVQEKDNAINDQVDLRMKLDIQFEKENLINAKKLEELLALRNKELEQAQIKKDQDYKLAQNKLDATLAKTTAEQAILDKQLDQDIIVNEEEELLKLHRNDYDKQASIKNEFFASLGDTTEGINKRVEELLKLEEQEIENRFNLKTSFLEEQRKAQENEHARLLSRVEYAYSQEEDYFKEEIDKLSKKDLAELDKYKEKKEEEIDTIAEGKVDLDPQADHRRIKEIDAQIADVRKEIQEEANRVKAEIAEKTNIYEANLELARQRKMAAKDELEQVYAELNQDVNLALEVLSNAKESELADARARYQKALEKTATIGNYAVTRNTLTTEENTKYLNDREDTENNIINTTKASFEDFRNTTNANKDNQLSNLEQQKQEINETAANAVQAEEQKQEEFASQIANTINGYENDATAKLNAQATAHAKQIATFEQTQNNVVADANKSLTIKDNQYKEAVASIDKKQAAEKKSFEDAKKLVQKNYDTELKKAITNINTRLAADIKAL